MQLASPPGLDFKPRCCWPSWLTHCKSFPLFLEGAYSPLDDVLDFAVAAVLVHLLGWHWEFLPSFAAKLVPGAGLVPFWTLAVSDVYRKWKQSVGTPEQIREQRPALPNPQNY